MALRANGASQYPDPTADDGGDDDPHPADPYATPIVPAVHPAMFGGPTPQPTPPPTTMSVPLTRHIDARAVMRRWTENASRDHSPVAQMVRLPLSADAAALWYGMRHAGLERRMLAGRMLYQQYGGGIAPDPEGDYAFSEWAVVCAAAHSFTPALQIVPAPPVFVAAVERGDPGRSSESLAWFVTQPYARVPLIMVRPTSDTRWLAWQVACYLGYYTKEAAIFTEGTPGLLNLIPRTREMPQLVSLLHRYAEALLRRPACSGTTGCVCPETRAHFNRPPADPQHPGQARTATDKLDANILRETARSMPLSQQPPPPPPTPQQQQQRSAPDFPNPLQTPPKPRLRTLVDDFRDERRRRNRDHQPPPTDE